MVASGDVARVFVSYRRNDAPGSTGRFHDRLTAKFGAENVFFDVDSIPPGFNVREHIDRVVAKTHALFAIIGPRWATDGTGARRLFNESDFVRQEIESALRRGIMVVPVLVEGAAMPPPRELPPSLRVLVDLNRVALRHDPDFHPDVDRLLRRLTRRPKPAQAPPARTAAPLVGAISEEDFVRNVSNFLVTMSAPPAKSVEFRLDQREQRHPKSAFTRISLRDSMVDLHSWFKRTTYRIDQLPTARWLPIGETGSLPAEVEVIRRGDGVWARWLIDRDRLRSLSQHPR